MRNVLSVLSVAALLGVPCTEAFAQSRSFNQSLSYTFLEIDYLNLDVDDFDDDEGLIDDWDDGDGFGIRGSFAFTQNFFAFAGYSETDSDATYVDADEVVYSSSQDLTSGHRRRQTGVTLPWSATATSWSVPPTPISI